MGENSFMPPPRGVLKHALTTQGKRHDRQHLDRRQYPNRGEGRPKGARNRVTAELVEQELARIAFFDPLQLFRQVQTAPGEAVVFTLRALHEMPADVRACIASVKLRHENLVAGDGVRDQTVELRFWDKIKALEICAKHLGYIDGKGGNISAKELLEFLEAGRRRNANRGASLVQPERPALGEGAVDAEVVARDTVPVDTVTDLDDDDAGDLTI